MSPNLLGSPLLPVNEKDLKLDIDVHPDDSDDEFGGKEARQRLERKLLRKIDLRLSILVVMYIVNYVNLHWFHSGLRLTMRADGQKQC